MNLTQEETFFLKQAYLNETKFAAGTVATIADQAIGYLQQAVQNPDYLEKVWKWLGKLKQDLGSEFVTLLDLIKQKGSQLLQQLGVNENQLASIGGTGVTTYK